MSFFFSSFGLNSVVFNSFVCLKLKIIYIFLSTIIYIVLYNIVQYALRAHKTFKINSRLLILRTPFKIYSAEMGGTAYMYCGGVILFLLAYTFSTCIQTGGLFQSGQWWCGLLRAINSQDADCYLFISLLSTRTGEDDIKY